jgi:hypothetical protein
MTAEPTRILQDAGGGGTSGASGDAGARGGATGASGGSEAGSGAAGSGGGPEAGSGTSGASGGAGAEGGATGASGGPEAGSGAAGAGGGAGAASGAAGAGGGPEAGSGAAGAGGGPGAGGGAAGAGGSPGAGGGTGAGGGAGGGGNGDGGGAGRRSRRPGALVTQWLPVIVAGVLVGALVLGIGVFLFSKDHTLLDALQDPTRARGLITFLIAITTIAIAIMLAISSIFGLGSGDDPEKRFDRGKQVLSVMIGILGTIVGFYFGSEKSQPSPQNQTAPTGIQSPNQSGQQSPLALSSLTISPPQASKGQSLTISFSISGGKAPYKYQISFEPQVSGLSTIKQDSVQAGLNKSTVTVPDTLDADKEVTCKISVTDSDNKTQDASQKVLLRVK